MLLILLCLIACVVVLVVHLSPLVSAKPTELPVLPEEYVLAPPLTGKGTDDDPFTLAPGTADH